jgi:predicted nuclease with TOPRIM domain
MNEIRDVLQSYTNISKKFIKINETCEGIRKNNSQLASKLTRIEGKCKRISQRIEDIQPSIDLLVEDQENRQQSTITSFYKASKSTAASISKQTNNSYYR